ncbi:MAG: tetratricopeptide repeat protein [Pirellulaceae bacterium]
MRLDAAALYIRLRRPDAAGPPVRELLQSDPDDARVLALAVQYFLLVDDHKQAICQADKYDRLYPGNIDLRTELAAALYASGNYAEAGRMFAVVLQQSPTNALALLGSARVALQDYRVDLADALLEQIPIAARGRPWQLVAVERDTVTGNYLRGHQILGRLCQEQPADRQTALALADLDRAENEFIKADARYQTEGATAQNSLAGQHYALSLYLQRRYCEAESVCRHVLARDPADGKTMMVLARILVRTQRPQEAVRWGQRAQRADPSVFPEGMYFAHVRAPEFASAPADSSRPIYLAVTLVDLAMEDGRREWAKAILDEALRAEPDNCVLRTRLAEWYASFGLPVPASRAAKIYTELLAREPANQKWLLGLARARVTLRCYDHALALYRRLRCESPANDLFAKEMARVVFTVYRGMLEWDITRQLSGYATGEYTDGAPYRGTGAYGGLAWIF